MSATVGDLQRMLALHSSAEEVHIEAQTKHSSNSIGIYLHVSVKAGGVVILSMTSDNREERLL